MAVALDASGDLYIADSGNYRVREVSGGIITTVAGDGVEGYSGDGNAATSATLSGNLTGLAVDAQGNVFISDNGNNVVREVVAIGGAVTPSSIIRTIAGDGTWGYNGTSGAATSIEFKGPEGLAVNAAGDVFVVDFYNAMIRDLSAGRLATDTVTSFGNLPTAAQTVNEIATTYDDVGRVQTVTSFGSGGTVVNQVREAYDGWGDLSQEWQSPAGPVNASTPSVQYVYADGSGTSGVAAYLQLSELVYPNGRILHYEYNSGADVALGRVSAIADDNGSGSPGQVDAAYTYLGADTIVTENYQQPQVKLDYTNGSGQITGLDRFGRVADQYWTSYGQNSGNAGTLDGYSYTYDADGNVLSRTNAVDSVMSEFYRYNSLDELTDFQRGASQSPVGQGANEEQYGLDALGNFSSIDNNGVTQTRTAGPSNEITGITGGTVTPAYDLAGNMTTMPQPGNATVALTCVYDAWDRLVEVTSGSTVVAQYQYDGTGRLLSETNGATTTYSFYDGQSLIETRVGGTAATNVQYQYVWSLRGDAIPILRDTYSGGAIQSASRIYYTTDANGNVTALIGLSGTTWVVIERYVYDPYGTVTVYNPAWTTALGGYASSTVGNTLFFGGMAVDPATGLQHADYRWYNSALATWTATDPLGTAGSGPNLYGYCGDSPANLVDPTGLDSWWERFVTATNPAWAAWKLLQDTQNVGYSVGTRIGSGWAAVTNNSFDTTLAIARTRQQRLVEELSAPKSSMTPAQFANGRGSVLKNGVSEAADIGYRTVDGLAAAAELGTMVAMTVAPAVDIAADAFLVEEMAELDALDEVSAEESAALQRPKAAPSPEPAPVRECPGAPGEPTPAGGSSTWAPGRYATSKGWATQRGGYWAARNAGKDVFPTLHNSGLKGDALATEQLNFFRRGLAAGKDPGFLRGQAAEAGYTRYTTSDADWLAQPGAENRLQQAIEEADQACTR